MISCIICSRNKDISEGLRNSIASTIGCDYELVIIDNSKKEYNIFTAYNEGVRRAKGDILCFMHDDILAYHTDDWGINVENHFDQDAHLGLIGIVGTHFMPNIPAEWYHCLMASGGCIQTVNGNTENCQYLDNFKNKDTILEAVLVDGMWMCIRKELFDRIRFDSENFSGWHCYDTDICLQVINIGYKVGIVSDVLLEHSSWGSFSVEWVNATKKVHAKWSHILPLVRNFQMSEDEIVLRTKYIEISMNYIFTIVKMQNELNGIRKSCAYRLGRTILKPIKVIDKKLKNTKRGGVDIILITYNQEKYIAQAIESILMQQVNNDIQLRIIIADDCSKDRTLEIIQSYEEKSPYPFVYLDSKQNLGIAANYKRAFNTTEAEFVAILEGDDYWIDKYRLQKHIDYLSSHEQCVFTKNNYLKYDHHNNEFSYDKINDNILTLRGVINNYVLPNMSCYVIRKSFIDQIDEKVYLYGYKQRNEAVDWYINIFLLQFGYGYIIDELMSVYRINTGNNISLTSRTYKEHLDKAYLCYTQSLELLGDKYKKECYQIYQDTVDFIKMDVINKRTQKLSNYFPPCLVSLTIKFFPMVGWNVKHMIRQCIPHKLYHIIRKRK